MTNTVKWGALGAIFAVLAIILYTLIDSDWALDNNASILVTIGFFAVATAAIVCGFNAVDSGNTIHHEH
jgi:hypothetical protein